jgi:hypothetical protein
VLSRTVSSIDEWYLDDAQTTSRESSSVNITDGLLERRAISHLTVHRELLGTDRLFVMAGQ